MKAEIRDANEEIGGKLESKDADEKGKRTSGISEMDAIAGTVVLELESLNPRRVLQLRRWRRNYFVLG